MRRDKARNPTAPRSGKKTGNQRGLEGECLLRHEGEEGRDHEGDAAEEIRP
jgi:hypothetical protein